MGLAITLKIMGDIIYGLITYYLCNEGPAITLNNSQRFVGITGKSVRWLPEIISGEFVSWDCRKVPPGLSTV